MVWSHTVIVETIGEFAQKFGSLLVLQLIRNYTVTETRNLVSYAV